MICDVSLDKPQHGWTLLNINDFGWRASYLTDVPNDILNASIIYLTTGLPFSVHLDGEGIETYVCSHSQEDVTYVIHAAEDKTIHSFELAPEVLIESLVHDIKTNIDDWVIWQDICFHESDKNEFMSRKSELKEKIHVVEELLKNKASHTICVQNMGCTKTVRL